MFDAHVRLGDIHLRGHHSGLARQRQPKSRPGRFRRSVDADRQEYLQRPYDDHRRHPQCRDVVRAPAAIAHFDRRRATHRRGRYSECRATDRRLGRHPGSQPRHHYQLQRSGQSERFAQPFRQHQRYAGTDRLRLLGGQFLQRERRALRLRDRVQSKRGRLGLCRQRFGPERLNVFGVAGPRDVQ